MNPNPPASAAPATDVPAGARGRPLERRRFLCAAASAALAVTAWPAAASGPLPVVEVFKSPTCGCCGAWVDHLKSAGFQVKVHVVDDTATMRRRHGLPDRFASCHTGIVGGYVVEGHVPAADVKRLLATRPAAIGIAVPGMPMGSPGMEVPGGRRQPFDVLLVDRQGRDTVFARHAGA